MGLWFLYHTRSAFDAVMIKMLHKVDLGGVPFLYYVVYIC